MRSNSTAPAVTVLHTTPFGAHVCDLLVTDLRAAEGRVTARALHREAGPCEKDVPQGGIVVLALGHQTPAVERAADDLARVAGAHLIPVVAEQSLVRIGPVLGPAATATMDCYYRRTLQHTATPALREVLDALDAQWPVTDLGHLPSTARTAAVLTSEIVRHVTAGLQSDLQQVTMFGAHRPDIGRMRLIGVHGNARSRPVVAERDRSWQLLAAHLRGVLAARDAPTSPRELAGVSP